MARPFRQTTLMQSKLHLESPPYRKVRALRLFDTPATPKTLIKKSSFDNGSAIQPNTHSKLIRKSILSNICGLAPRTPNIADRPKAMPVHNKALEPLTANINPFSPSSKSTDSSELFAIQIRHFHAMHSQFYIFSGFIQKKKRSRTEEHCTSTRNSTESLMNKSNLSISSLDEDVSCGNATDDEWQAPKRLALQDANLPRYEQEFVELSLIGENLLSRERNEKETKIENYSNCKQ